GPTIAVMSSGDALPTALDATSLNIFDPAAVSRGAELERYEFMRMSVSSITVSEPTNGFGEFWGVEPPRARPFREPGIESGDPIPAADDGPYAGSPPPLPPIFDGNFERVMVDSDDAITAANVRRSQVIVSTGAIVTGISGPLDFGFLNYRIVLDADATPGVVPGVTAATPAPVRNNNEFTIAHANLQNFGVSNGNFADRLNKASLAIRNVLRTPDILGVIEVFDLPSLQQLATKVNTDVGNPSVVNYQAYLDESASTFADSQDIGYLVNTARVTVVGAPVQYHRTDTFTYCGNTDLLHDRPSYVLTADVPQAGTADLLRVTVVLNHTKSLIAVDSQQPSGSCGTGTVGARNREKRRLQADDIADLIDSLQNQNLVVLGDLNAFEFNDGLTDVEATFKGDPTAPEEVVEPSTPDRWTHQLSDLITTLTPDQRYSLLFEGNAQALDHVLVNNKMLARNKRFAYARYNADFPAAFATDASRPERLADHDAAVAYFAPLADLSVTKSASPEPVVTGSNVTYSITVANNGPDSAANVVMTDNLPAQTTFVSCNATGGGVCGGSGNSRTVTFASLSSGASETVTLVATVNCDVVNGLVISNSASVSSDTDDPNSADNSQTAMTSASNPPPTIDCPANITLEPTCPSGAIALYTEPVVTDNCPGATPIRTAGPASGSVFPIGTTTVTYSVTDSGGNGPVSCSFTVTVKTSSATINDLKNSVQSSSLSGQQRQGLIGKLNAALDAINKGHTNTACAKLADFINSVQNYVDHGNISAAQGQAWIHSAAHVRNTLGCTNNPCT
ncbi:MAG TPA: HYR domain-containing protein, partial [Pyrinomonadaceae bacterium]|nr:HYR domain-containing protein [Pyrinomonadaceae bacterium]